MKIIKANSFSSIFNTVSHNYKKLNNKNYRNILVNKEIVKRVYTQL